MNQVVLSKDGERLTAGWWILALVGLLGGIAGVIILLKPSDSLETLAVIAGIYLLVTGILEMAASLMRGTANRGLIAIFGALTAIVGVLLIRHPVGGVTFVALLIGIWLIAIGVVRFATAFDEFENRGWNIGVGVVQVLAGVVIVVDSDIGYTTLALLVGLGFIVNGIMLMAYGFSLRALGKAAE